MHRGIRDLLHSAHGRFEHVVVLLLDIRGFSSFAKIAESPDAAEFLKVAYISMLDQELSGATFFKLTGDGLLVLFGYARETLTEVVRNAVGISLRLLERFPTICDGDPMVNFDVPKQLGIGLARGGATALVSDETVLDYSGRPLNLASRLMDLARPSGVVFPGDFGIELLDEETRRRFAQDEVYIKGLAEDIPMTVHYLRNLTRIPAFNKAPLNRFERYTELPETRTLRQLEEMGRFRHPLSQKPAQTDDIQVHISYPATTASGNKHPTLVWSPSARAAYAVIANKQYAVVDYAPWVKQMKEKGVKPSWQITLTVEYSITGGAATTNHNGASVAETAQTGGADSQPTPAAASGGKRAT
jgi:class 3 adenylate cyclase